MSEAMSPHRNDANLRPRGFSGPIRTAQATATPVGLALLLCYLTLEYLRPQTFWPALGALQLPALALSVLFILTIPKLFSTSDAKFAPQSSLLLAFLALSALSILYAANWFRAYKFTYGIVVIMLAYFAIAYLLRDVRDIDRVLSLLVAIHIYLSLRGIVGFFQRDFNEAGYSSTGYVGGAFLKDENDYALALNLIIPIAIYLAMRSRAKSWRLFWGIGCAILLATTIFTFSRGGFTGLAAMAVCWAFTAKKKGPAIAAIFIGAILIVAIAPAQYWQRISTITATDQGTALERQKLWAAARLMFYDYPIGGVGGNNFGVHVADYALEFPADFRPNLWGKAVHSMYFQLLAEFGLVGLVLISGVIILNFRRVNEMIRLGKSTESLASLGLLATSLRASWVGFLVSATFLSVLDFPHLYYFTALTVASHRIALAQSPTSRRDKVSR